MDDDYAREYAWYLEGCRLLGWEDSMDGDEFHRLYRQWVNSSREINDFHTRLAHAGGIKRAAVMTVEGRRLRAVWRVYYSLSYVASAVEKGRGSDGPSPEGALVRPGPRPRGGAAASPLPPESAREP